MLGSTVILQQSKTQWAEHTALGVGGGGTCAQSEDPGAVVSYENRLRSDSQEFQDQITAGGFHAQRADLPCQSLW